MTLTIRVAPPAAKPARKRAPRTVKPRRWTFPGTNPSGKRLTIVLTDPVHPRRSRNNLLLNTPSPRQASKPVGAREDSEIHPSLVPPPITRRERAKPSYDHLSLEHPVKARWSKKLRQR